MGKRGPKPAGSKVHSLPKPAERPAPPRGMSPRARALWVSLVRGHAPNHFGPGDRHLLQAYCEAYNDFVEASETLRAEGRYIAGASGAKKRHPAIADVNDARNAMSMLATKLRMCANSRIDKRQAGAAKPDVPTAPGRKMFGGAS